VDVSLSTSKRRPPTPPSEPDALLPRESRTAPSVRERRAVPTVASDSEGVTVRSTRSCESACIRPDSVEVFAYAPFAAGTIAPGRMSNSHAPTLARTLGSESLASEMTVRTIRAAPATNATPSVKHSTPIRRGNIIHVADGTDPIEALGTAHFWRFWWTSFSGPCRERPHPPCDPCVSVVLAFP